ncbi:MAG: response regulator [Terriglobales bacterium]
MAPHGTLKEESSRPELKQDGKGASNRPILVQPSARRQMPAAPSAGPFRNALPRGERAPGEQPGDTPQKLIAAPPYKVLVADDLPIVREGLSSLINRQPDMRVVSEAESGAEAIAQFLARQPDLGIIDLSMSDMNGIEVVTSICEKLPGARLLIFTASHKEEDIYQVLRAGVQGYLLKSASMEELVNCIRAVASGESWIPSAIAAKLVKRVADRELTRRETEVMRAIAIGKSNKEIGCELGISDGTVKVHVSHILEKLKAGGRTEAINFAVKRGLVRMDWPLAA